MKISDQVKDLEQQIERYQRSREVMIDKVSLFVANYLNGAEYVPESRSAAVSELVRLLNFAQVQPEDIPDAENRKRTIYLMGKLSR